jgi:hypothetical protein
MQKKKPPFQVIPNCGVSGFTNWNESKEVAAEQGRNDLALRNFSDAAGLFRSVNRHRHTIPAISRPEPNSHNPHTKMVRRNRAVIGEFLAGWGSPVH